MGNARKDVPLSKSELRRQAEERQKANEAATRASELPADQQRLLQELQIHQIELEMQNEELIRSQNETDAFLEKYLDIYDFSPIGYFTLNHDGIIMQVNLTGASILGVERSRLIGRKFQLYISAECFPTFNTFFSKTYRGEKIESCEVKLPNGGTPHFVQLDARLSGNKEECNLAMFDITDRKRAEAALEERTRQLEDVNKEMESFSYSVSHDLRAPLRAIDGYTRMILRKHAEKFDADALQKFNVITDNTRMMGQLIEDLLAFSRLGTTPLSMAKIDPEGLMREVWEELKAANPERHLTLKIANLPPCMGDRGLIKQVFANLLGNAVKFTKTREEGLIEAGGEAKGSESLYYIRDNGVGFDMRYHDKMFGVFQRLHSADQFEGTGVGLALCQRIIHRHGGKIWAEGEVDKGATFYFTLPTQQE